MSRLAKQLAAAARPPVMEAYAWAEAADLPPDRPMLNVSQAAPVAPPPEALRQAMAEAVLSDPSIHLYGPVLGHPPLRAEIASQWSAQYAGQVAEPEVAITAGCNQAFCAAIATSADAGDAVILPTPWYFNHKMWLDIAGVEARPLPCGADMIPDPERAAALIDDRVRAIVLVTPNNPTGAEYPPETVAAFYDLARRRNLALIVDETYKDFHAADGPPHGLFAQDWQGTLIHLYSFSKVYRLTGHRVGALIAGRGRVAQVEKFLDTVTICPAQLGQRAALFGLRNLGPWVAAERAEILRRRSHIGAALDRLTGWRLLGLGAYFAYLAHPFDMASDRLAERLAKEAGILLLPGTMFAPPAALGGDGAAERQVRIAFANADIAGLDTLLTRLAAFRP